MQPNLMGMAHYGYPFPWLIRLQIPTQYSGWRIDIVSFFVGVTFWSFMVGAL